MSLYLRNRRRKNMTGQTLLTQALMSATQLGIIIAGTAVGFSYDMKNDSVLGTVVGAIGGTIVGAKLAEKFKKNTRPDITVTTMINSNVVLAKSFSNLFSAIITRDKIIEKNANSGISRSEAAKLKQLTIQIIKAAKECSNAIKPIMKNGDFDRNTKKNIEKFLNHAETGYITFL